MQDFELRSALLFERACMAGHAPSCAKAGLIAEYGDESSRLEPNYARASELYDTACRRDELQACGNLIEMYENGRLKVPPDYGGIARRYQAACDRGLLSGCTRLAGMRRTGAGQLPRDHGEALELYRKACDAGDEKACRGLGEMREQGEGLPSPDVAQAVVFYEKAGARDKLASLYARGLGEDSTAVEFFAEGCKSFSAPNCSSLAALYETGARGLTRDLVQAAALYRRACFEFRQANAVGCAGLAALYANDPGDVAHEAPDLFAGACNAGNADACLGIAASYENGRLGRPKDAARALELYQRACALGHTATCSRVNTPAASSQSAARPLTQ